MGAGIAALFTAMLVLGVYAGDDAHRGVPIREDDRA